MSHTGKLYQYYLKKSLWRSWRLWLAVALCWVWWVAYSWLGAYQFKEALKGNQVSALWTESELEQEFGWKGMLEKSYQGGLLCDEESAEWWEEQAAQVPGTDPKKLKYQAFALGIRGGSIWTISEKNAQNLSKEAKWRAKYVNNSYPFYVALTEFSARQTKLEQGGIGKKIALIHHLSLWNMSGIILGTYLAYSLLNSLFMEAKKNGEDALVLNLNPGVERNHLLGGKILTLLSNLAIYAFLGFVLPYTIFLFAFGPGITAWGNYSLLVFWTTFLSPVLFLLFPAALYLSAGLWGITGKIIQFIIQYFSLGWFFLGLVATSALTSKPEAGNQGFFSIVAKIEYYYYQPLVHIAFAVVLGGLLLIFFSSYYQQEDLS